MLIWWQIHKIYISLEGGLGALCIKWNFILIISCPSILHGWVFIIRNNPRKWVVEKSYSSEFVCSPCPCCFMWRQIGWLGKKYLSLDWFDICFSIMIIQRIRSSHSFHITNPALFEFIQRFISFFCWEYIFLFVCSFIATFV